MSRKSIFTAITILSVTFLANAAEKKAEAKASVEKKEQTHCPVMQRYPVDKTMWIDIKGKRIYTCCKGCQNQIKANPDKYIKRLEDKGVILEKVPAKKTSKDDTKSK